MTKGTSKIWLVGALLLCIMLKFPPLPANGIIPAQNAVKFIETYCTHTKSKWAGKPFHLIDDWQRPLVMEIFGRVKPDGLRRYRFIFVEVPKKNGKCLKLLTKVPTKDGWKTIGQIKSGDIVFDENGKQTKVISVSGIFRDHDCYEIVFSNKEKIIADADHKWAVERRINKHFGNKQKWLNEKCIKTTREIAESVYFFKRLKYPRYRVKIAEPLRLKESKLPFDPYVLGVWLGDGFSHESKIIINKKDHEIIEEIKRRGVKVNICATYASGCDVYRLGKHRQKTKSFTHLLGKNGLQDNKHIPLEYLRSSFEQRLDLLRGLMDTDGTIRKDGFCKFSTVIKSLRNGFIELLRTLSIRPSISTHIPKLNGKKHKRVWEICFSSPEFDVFFLERKKCRQKLRKGGGKSIKHLWIKEVKKTKSVPVKCIAVDSPSNLFLVSESMIPTHNSEIGATIALKMLIADGEHGGEIYSAAGDIKQAALVYNVAAQMVRNNPVLNKRLRIIDSQKRIVDYKTNSYYQVLSAEAFSKHGLSPSAVLFDEIHAQPNHELWEVLTEGTDYGRTQQLVFVMTTAGEYDEESVGWEVHDYALKVRDGIIKDDSWLPIIYACEEKDNWEDEEVWKRTNPSLGHIFDLDKIRRDFNKAKVRPDKAHLFKRFRLNMWVNNIMAWIPMDDWNKCADPVDYDSLRGRICFGGLDLSTKIDMTAFALVFPPAEPGEKFKILVWFYCPEEKLSERSKRDKVNYHYWVKRGYITAIPGRVIDYSMVKKDILQADKDFRIKEIAYDPWGAAQFTIDLENNEGIEVVEHRQGWASMSDPTKQLHAEIISHNLAHGGNPVLNWNASNFKVKVGDAEAVKPEKDKNGRKRIDGIVAVIMALGRAQHHIIKESVYEKEDLKVL